LKLHGRLQAIAAIVARTACDPDMTRVWSNCQCQFGKRQTSTLHQGMGRQRRLKGQLNMSTGLIPVQGISLAWIDLQHGDVEKNWASAMVSVMVFFTANTSTDFC
jgi:hypothetical protein